MFISLLSLSEGQSQEQNTVTKLCLQGPHLHILELSPGHPCNQYLL